jgi:hypothetical protein
MNLYFLDLLSTCKKGRRESVESLRLPNGKWEGIDYNTWYWNIWKKGRIIFSVSFDVNDRTLDVELEWRGGKIKVEVPEDESHFILSFTLPGFDSALKYDSDIEAGEGFQHVLDRIDFSKAPIPRKNYMRRTFTPTLIDGLVDEWTYEEEEGWFHNP